jgi:hypothetical protein
MHERLLFIGLFSHADDVGRIEGDPALLRSTIFPRDEISIKKMGDWLAGLEAHGFIRRYTATGEPYVEITNWSKHQKVDRPSPSSIPSYDDRDLIGIAS